MVTYKKIDDIHFTKNFEENGSSDRIVLPKQDDVSVKVTMFKGNQGVEWPEIKYDCDETVYVTSGKVALILAEESEEVVLGQGAVYTVKAGENYGMKVLEDNTNLLCVFSVSIDGTLPDSE